MQFPQSCLKTQMSLKLTTRVSNSNATVLWMQPSVQLEGRSTVVLNCTNKENSRDYNFMDHCFNNSAAIQLAKAWVLIIFCQNLFRSL